MTTSKAKLLTPVELEIMKVLWETGPANVQTVREKLPTQPRPAYTTVQTMLNVLLRKGRVRRVLKGQAYEYSAVTSKKSAVAQVVLEMVHNLFEGSAEGLVMNLIESDQLTPEKLARLMQMVEHSQAGKEKDHDGD